MKYFKSYYEPGITYPKGYYGTLDFAPLAMILLYNDKEGFCIGTIDDVVYKKLYVSESVMESQILEITIDRIPNILDLIKDEIYLIRIVEIEEIQQICVDSTEEDDGTRVIKRKNVIQEVNPFNIIYVYGDGRKTIDGKHIFVKNEIVYDVPGIEYISEEDALKFIRELDINDPNIWFGDRLESRWNDE